MATVGELKREAAVQFTKGKPLVALQIYDWVLRHETTDYSSRMRAADCIGSVGHKAEAIAIYRATAWYCLRAGHPLSALVCARVVSESLGGDTDDIMARFIVQYEQGSELIGKFAARVSAPSDDADIAAPYLTADIGAEFIAEAAHRAAHCTDDFQTYPEVVHPVPLLSEVSEDALRRLVGTMVVGRLPAGAPIIKEGEPGQSFFFVASGQVRVFDTDALGRTRDLAILHGGSIFGEMALLSAEPRSASVVARTECDVLELGRESLAALADELPAVAAALSHFTQQRLVENLLAQNPLFRPFNKAQRRDLLKRFQSYDVAGGTDIIHEGDQGTGLFMVLSGELAVTKRGDAAKVELATLKPGDVFGEMSLIRNEPTSATVTANRPSTVLFLAKETVERMVAGIPAIRDYLQNLSEDRDLDNQMAALDGTDENDDGSVVILF